MKKSTDNLSKADKILVFMHELKNDGYLKVNYEDLVVGLFKRFPQDFHLKGYTDGLGPFAHYTEECTVLRL